MRMYLASALIAFVLAPLCGWGQSGAGLLPPERVIDWSKAGVGDIPARSINCARLTPSATLEQINAALHRCSKGQTVFLEPGVYQIPGTIVVPSEVTLRGAGADRTILNATGSNHGYVIHMGNESVPFAPINIQAGANAGSTQLTLASAKRIDVGQYLVVSESNDPAFVTARGLDGLCRWCDGWTSEGRFARGQIVEVTGIQGNLVQIAPALYSAYKQTPIAVPFRMVTTKAGVEDLQVYANNTGYDASFGMELCARCWIRGVEANYTDGDFVEIFWGFHDEVRDSYFSNSFLHRPGKHDTGIHLGYKTSASLIENNIVERGRVSFDLGWGEAGNVFGYNFTTGEFIADAPDSVIGGFRFHGAHGQFNLFEGNITTGIDMDATWGSSSHLTAFRNWLRGTNRVCGPYSGRNTANCASTGHYSFQGARAVQLSCLGSQSNFVGNLLGSAAMQSLIGYNKPLAQVPSVVYPEARDYDHVAYGWTFGYSDFTKSGVNTVCGYIPQTDRIPSDFIRHGNYNNIDRSVHWMNGVSHVLPASLYLNSRPSWWKEIPFPAIGPDIYGGEGPGRHSYGNPAEHCYRAIMGGNEGGPGSPYKFNAAACY